MTRLFFTALFLSASLCLQAQNPFVAGTTWKTSQRIDGPFEEISIEAYKPTQHRMDAYTRIEFKAGNQFEAYNIPGCGLDCVVHALGTYTTTPATVQFTITSITRHKGCQGQSQPNTDIGTYFLVKDEYSFRLLKNLDDEPKENYFDDQKIAVPAFTDAEAQRLIKKYQYLYNRIYQIVKNNNKNKLNQIRQDEGQWRFEAFTYANVKNTEQGNRFRTLALDWDNKLLALINKLRS